MAAGRHITVILPLKLEWEPFYSLPESCPDLQVGDRVSVPFAGKTYLAVVSAVNVQVPDGAAAREKEIFGLRQTKDRIYPSEIEFWRLLASYYLCTVGEVYKAAYPSSKDETVSARKKEKVFVPMSDMPEDDSSVHRSASDALRTGKPVVLSVGDDVSALLSLCRDEAMCGTNVLWLVPELKFSKVLETRLRDALGSRLLVWGSNITPARKREVAALIRKGEPYVVLGTRSSLFLPHRSLGMVIVQDEFDPSYKQVSPAPRYNTRDAAVLLASVFGARVVMSAADPSLETAYNCLCGKYLRVIDESGTRTCDVEIVDTKAEIRKNGMVGELSRKLIEAVGSAGLEHTVFYKPRRAAFPKLEDLSAALCGVFGPDCFISDDLVETPPPSGATLLAFFGIDALLGRNDFRADERALQTVHQAIAQCGDALGRLIVQTREPSRAVFATIVGGDLSSLLEERRNFGLPPFSRLVDVLIQDTFPDRAIRMSSLLASAIGRQGIGAVTPLPDRVRVAIPRDNRLRQAKMDLVSTLDRFQKENHYAGHLIVDVDPVS